MLNSFEVIDSRQSSHKDISMLTNRRLFIPLQELALNGVI
jgi:hypothetical protein